MIDKYTNREFATARMNIMFQAIKIRSLEEAISKKYPDLMKEWDEINDRMQKEAQEYLTKLSDDVNLY